MKCKKCGAEITDNALQCDVCGAPVEEEMSDFDEETKIIDMDELREAANNKPDSEESDFNEQDEAAQREEELDENALARRAQMQKMQEEKQKQLSEIERRRNAKKKRQRRTKAIIIGIICALLVGGAGIGAYYIAKNVTDGTTAISATPTPTALPAVSPAATVVPSPSPVASPAASTAPAARDTSSAESTASSQRTASSTSSQRTASSQGSSSSQGAQSSSQSKSSSQGSSSGKSGSQSKTSESGLVSDPINGKSVKGGQVIYNEGTGRYLMTFTMDGKVYYANVSEGSTTEQIKDKTFTIDATATNESYGGNTVYEISSMNNTTQSSSKQTSSQNGKSQSATSSKSGSYIFADTDKRLLTANDIKGMSKYDLALARNEIFARHGRKFQMKEYANYFAKKSWYKINPNYNYSDDFANLNSTEIQNVKFIQNAEK